MGKMRLSICMVMAVCLLPQLASAQLAEDISGMQSVLDNIYDTMIPMCSQLIGVGQGIAGFAALWYIASRVWKHLANAEPIDFYPLLRPFAIGLCIMLFPAVIGLIRGVMQPTVSGTAAMVEGSNKAIEVLLQQKEEALMKTDKWQMYVGMGGAGDRDKWYKYTYDEDASEEGWMDGIGNDIRFAMEKYGYQFRHSVKQWMSEILEILYQAAALCINTLRTFQLVVLTILGPLVFGLAVFDGFQHTLTVWLARYINIFLWLPVANVFGAIIGKVQEEMIKLDVRQIEDSGNTFFSSTDIGYLIFLIIGIIGYTTVPTVANYIVHAAGAGALQQKMTNLFFRTTQSAAGVGAAVATGGAGAVLAAGGMAADALGDAAGRMSNSMATHEQNDEYLKDKLKGNS